MDIAKKIISKTLWDELGEKIWAFEQKLNELDKLKGTHYPMFDAHIHVVDFNQKTLWLKNLIHYMDKTNVKAGVVFWLPVIKSWQENEKQRPNYYLDDDNPCYYYPSTDDIVAREYKKLSKKDQKRIYPLLCWFNPTDINSVDHIRNTFLNHPGCFCGIGEVLYRHDDLTHLTLWETPRMNTQATKRLFEFACEYDLPLCIHNNITAPWVSDFPKFLHEMEEVIREFPKARVVLCHCGASRRLRSPYYPKMIARLLREYPGLFIEYSWVVYDEIIIADEASLDEWVELTETFPTRIIIWSDVLWDNYHQIWIINSRFNIFLDKLTPQTRKKVCLQNALSIYGKSRNNVEKNKKRSYPTLKSIIQSVEKNK